MSAFGKLWTALKGGANEAAPARSRRARDAPAAQRPSVHTYRLPYRGRSLGVPLTPGGDLPALHV